MHCTMLVLCCAYHVHDKTSLRCFCVSLWILWNTKVVGIIIFNFETSYDYVFLHFALFCTLFIFDSHTHILCHVWVLIAMLISFYWYYMFSHVNLFFELCFKFCLVLNSKFWFGTNLVLIKFVAICVLSCSLILHDTTWQCLNSRNQPWKEVVAREKRWWLILIASLLSQRRLDHR